MLYQKNVMQIHTENTLLSTLKKYILPVGYRIYLR